MNNFLFCYPIEPYLNSRNSGIRLFEFHGNSIDSLFELIDRRYRDLGYNISWLLFSKKDDPKEPDVGLLSHFCHPNESDMIISSGVDYDIHCNEKLYPKPEFIYKQFESIDNIVIGGFHQWDCVDKIASYFHNAGIETMVDEDLTEMFFVRKVFGYIPIIRDEWTLENLGVKKKFIEHNKEIRKNKPWFVQN